VYLGRSIISGLPRFSEFSVGKEFIEHADTDLQKKVSLFFTPKNIGERASHKLMNNQTLQLILTQLAILLFAAMVMISQSQFVFTVALLLGFMLSYSVGSSLALADKIRQVK